MVSMYDGLIYSIIYRYYNGYLSKEDLFQVGRMGLMKAYENYDPSQGVKFETYAYNFIRGEMYQVIQKDRAAKFSRSIIQLKSSIERATILLTQELMRKPTVLELANYLEEPESKIVEALQTVYQAESLQTPVAQEEKELVIEDLIAAPQVDLDTLIIMKEAIKQLSPFEQELFMRRYYGQTQHEIAEQMGIHQVQVSRKVKKIGEKINQQAA